MIEGIITRKGGGGSSTKAFPNFSYTGENFIQPLGTGRNAFNALWLTSSGILNFTKNVYADVFLVGGGGGGGSGTGADIRGGGAGGGGGGYTLLLENVFIPANTEYKIDIGKGGYPSVNYYRQGDPGNRTRAFGFFANGGYGGGSTKATNVAGKWAGGDGASGGGGGIDNQKTSGGTVGIGGAIGINGSDGGIGRYLGSSSLGDSEYLGGKGSGKSTHLFYNDEYPLVSYGGAGGLLKVNLAEDDRFHVESPNLYPTGAYKTNYGSGGMGGSNFRNLFDLDRIDSLEGTRGQDGVVVIRNKSSFSIPKFSYGGDYILYNVKDKNWELKFLTNGTFIPQEDMDIDAFLVGGGGSGASCLGGGGSGGHTTTRYDITLRENQEYAIEIGKGGDAPVLNENAGDEDDDVNFRKSLKSYGNFGMATSAFNCLALGGSGGTPHPLRLGGSGGSGGGYGTNKNYNAENGKANGANSEQSGRQDSTGRNCFGYGLGQGYTTRAFEEENKRVYAGGGGGGGSLRPETNKCGAFGRDSYGGGGLGGLWYGVNGRKGEDSFGAGGGGGANSGYGGAGGAGTVIIRKSTVPSLKNIFNVGEEWIWRKGNTAKIISNSTFTANKNVFADICLVGGGGGGGYNIGGGGGGGYLNTFYGIRLSTNNTYSFSIGNGGAGGYHSRDHLANTDEGEELRLLYDGEQTVFNTPFKSYIAEGGKQGYPGTKKVDGDWSSNLNKGQGGDGGSGGGGGSFNTGESSVYFAGYGGWNGSIGHNGTDGKTYGMRGNGQDTSTRAFGEENGELFSGGGCGGTFRDPGDTSATLGGIGGGGSSRLRKEGSPNTGGGGCGGNLEEPGYNGGSGVALLRIRNDIPDFDYYLNFNEDNKVLDTLSNAWSANNNLGVRFFTSDASNIRYIRFYEEENFAVITNADSILENGENASIETPIEIKDNSVFKVETNDSLNNITVTFLGYYNEEKEEWISSEDAEKSLIFTKENSSDITFQKIINSEEDEE